MHSAAIHPSALQSYQSEGRTAIDNYPSCHPNNSNISNGNAKFLSPGSDYEGGGWGEVEGLAHHMELK